MGRVALYAKIRYAVMVNGLSRRDAGKRFGVRRNTIS
jgi:transposase